MISLWDMIISSRFPSGGSYSRIGIAVFIISLILSAGIMPLVIHSIWLIVKPIGMRRGIFGRAEHDFNHYRVTLGIFVSILILQVVTTIISIHGLFFLINMKLYSDYLVNLDNNGVDFLGYVVPSSHHVLYFIEACLEAARENLLLWGFLFLVNYICKLVVKKFYFKIFTGLLIVRVLFVFVCAYRIPELIANKLHNINSSYFNVIEASSPFHTFSKSLRTLEILINVIICFYFMLYLWRQIGDRIKILDQRPDHQEASPFDTQMNTLCNRNEMLRIKKYSILYASLLISELILNLIQCQFPNFFYTYYTNDVHILTSLEMALAITTDILSFVLPLLTILFILILIRSMGEYRNRQENSRNYGSITGDHQAFNDLTRKAKLKLISKGILVNGFAIFVIAFLITAFTSYLWYSPGNRIHLVFRPGDYLHLDRGEICDYMRTCDHVSAERIKDSQFTVFDINSVPPDFLVPRKCPNETSIVFYRNITQPEIQTVNISISDINHITGEQFWYPNGSYFDNFNVNTTVTLLGDYLPNPCYSDKYQLTGFEVTCNNYSGTRPHVNITCEINTNKNNRCNIQQTGVYTFGDFNPTVSSLSLSRFETGRC